MEENKTAKLFGLFAFDAFNQDHIRNVRIATGILSLALILICLVVIKSIVMNPAFNEHELTILFIYLITSFLILLTGAFLFVKLHIDLDIFLYKALSKVNADHLLSEFNTEKSLVPYQIKKDIEKNGYFSAYGYLEVKEQEAENNKAQKLRAEKKLKQKNIKANYPDIFKD